MQPSGWLSPSVLFISLDAVASKHQVISTVGLMLSNFMLSGVRENKGEKKPDKNQYKIKNHHGATAFINLPEVLILVT